MHPYRSKSVLSAIVLALGLCVATTSSAQKAPKAKASTTKAGVKVKRWKANGVRFEHRTHGNSRIGWERHATTKDSAGGTTTKIHGKLWGNKIQGKKLTLGHQTAKDVTATSPSGQTRRTMTFSDRRTSTVRKTIYMQPENVIRKITSWVAGGTKMTATRDYKAKPNHPYTTDGKPTSVRRTGTKVESSR